MAHFYKSMLLACQLKIIGLGLTTAT